MTDFDPERLYCPEAISLDPRYLIYTLLTEVSMKDGYTYNTTRHYDTDPHTRRQFMWVFVTRSDGLRVRSTNWHCDDGSAEAEASARMARLEAEGGFAPVEVRDAAKAMLPADPCKHKSKGPVPSDVRWRVAELLRSWCEWSTVASIRERIAIIRRDSIEERAYLAALQAELDLRDKVLDAIERGLDGGGGGA